jgi:hypothetical protein
LQYCMGLRHIYQGLITYSTLHMYFEPCGAPHTIPGFHCSSLLQLHLLVALHAKRQPMLRSKHDVPKLAVDGRYDDGGGRYEYAQMVRL